MLNIIMCFLSFIFFVLHNCMVSVVPGWSEQYLLEVQQGRVYFVWRLFAVIVPVSLPWSHQPTRLLGLDVFTLSLKFLLSFYFKKKTSIRSGVLKVAFLESLYGGLKSMHCDRDESKTVFYIRNSVLPIHFAET